MPKEYFDPQNEQFDIERFEDALDMIRDKLHQLEEDCIDNDVLRDTVIVAVEGYCKQLEAIRRACKRGDDRSPHNGD
jgi:FPC/CPF motif-containing protein YcgG